MSRIPKERSRPYDRTEPKSVGDLMGELIALRGLAQTQSRRQFEEVWRKLIGDDFAELAKATGLKNGVLQVVVSNSALLSELASFRKHELLERFRTEHADLKVRDIKFKLRGKPTS
ncbi:DUF721 domain-containing protein [Thalassoglobus neptunius]|nr:DUF721 domain-containing protein [Thalassoglobus neptunius]